jgi:hypothetical protein
MDDIDKEIFESLKSQFETLLGMCVSNYRDQNFERGHRQYSALIKTFNDGVDSRMKLLERIKELELQLAE